MQESSVFKPGVNRSTDKNLLDLIGVATVLTSTGSFLKGDRLAQSITPNSRKGRGRGVDLNPPLCLLTAQLVTQTLPVVITVQSESQGRHFEDTMQSTGSYSTIIYFILHFLLTLKYIA